MCVCARALNIIVHCTEETEEEIYIISKLHKIPTTYIEIYVYVQV